MFSNFAAVDLSAMPSIVRGEARTHRVKLVAASSETLCGFGHIVPDFARGKVTIVIWPQPGWRPIVDGTGNEGGIVEDNFTMERRGEVQHAVNNAVGRSYITGWFSDPATASADREPADTSRIFTHEANYHPDGGQLFFPLDRRPFYVPLALPGDDITPQRFVCFRFDGHQGLYIHPNVWHEGVFSLGGTQRFFDRQGAVHARVSVEFAREFGCLLEAPI